MLDIRHDNYYYMSTSKILPKGFGVVFPESQGFGDEFPDSKELVDEFPDSIEVLTSKPEFISSINPKYFASCFIILYKFLID